MADTPVVAPRARPPTFRRRPPTPRKRPPRPAARYHRAAWAFSAPFCAVFAIAIVAPLAYATYLSLFQDRLVGGTVFVGLDNYLTAFGDRLLHVGLLRVALFLAVQVPIMLGLALLAALALDSGRLRFAGVYRIGIFAPYAVPAVVAALMWGYLYGDEFGLAGGAALSGPWILTSIGNIVTWEWTGYNMLILYAALRVVPGELYEAAEIDGAGEIRKAVSIKLPALRPALLLAAIFSIIGSFQLFNEPNVLAVLAPAEIATSYTPNMYAYNLAFNGQQYNYAAAVAVVLGGVTIVVAYAVQLTAARRERRS
ncbi:carbohydrate ABC transporter permease [Planomonospora sp. ID82291]|uniref:carbohydrate ABC transporter permease n=1 Tax=Planomonospora sp. ID82291 TaxID=2738136 RepID=UPI0018C3B40E|nr:sugar ABC transporter permease [Planomonospora sp. ID82291]MBG0818862.1 sugar ABC transporter permease [Planomonospora sp. ID82291]